MQLHKLDLQWHACRHHLAATAAELQGGCCMCAQVLHQWTDCPEECSIAQYLAEHLSSSCCMNALALLRPHAVA